MDSFISAVNTNTEQLLCARYCSRKWGYSSEQDKILAPLEERENNYYIYMSRGVNAMNTSH